MIRCRAKRHRDSADPWPQRSDAQDWLCQLQHAVSSKQRLIALDSLAQRLHQEQQRGRNELIASLMSEQVANALILQLGFVLNQRSRNVTKEVEQIIVAPVTKKIAKRKRYPNHRPPNKRTTTTTTTTILTMA